MVACQSGVELRVGHTNDARNAQAGARPETKSGPKEEGGEADDMLAKLAGASRKEGSEQKAKLRRSEDQQRGETTLVINKKE